MCWGAPAVPDWSRLGWAEEILSEQSRAMMELVIRFLSNTLAQECTKTSGNLNIVHAHRLADLSAQYFA